MTEPSIETLRGFAGEYPVLPVWRKIRSDAEAVDAFRAFKHISRRCFILESLEDKENMGRRTILGFDPKLEISCDSGLLRIKNGATIEIQTDDPAPHIEKILAEYKSPAPSLIAGTQSPPPPDFAGGLVGFFSFDFIRYCEPKLNAGRKAGASPDASFKDCDLVLFDKLIVWDNLSQTIYLFANIKTDALEENYNLAQTALDGMERVLSSGPRWNPAPLRITEPFRELFGKADYCRMVEKAKRYIYEGDIFQVVLSNMLEAKVEGSIFGAYLELRRANPSPYMFYFSSDDMEISGASPETLVKLQNGEVRTFPIAGTRPRGATPEEDAALEKELLADPKELAEHNMLVDLGRNDIGKLCEFGTVETDGYMNVLRFSHVMHIATPVRGRVRPDVSALDAIAAVLPAGTLSGAPKIRAIEIIDELEQAPRGIYGGAIGYIAFSGAMDTCIAIRSAYKKGGTVFVRSGAGIVADSVPENEYEECRNKMRAVTAALEKTALKAAEAK